MKNRIFYLSAISFCILLLLNVMGGCTTIQSSDEPDSTALAVDQPYSLSDFNEISIPAGLELNRDESLFITTDSFKGGFLNFSGRLEVNSLTDFFINSMPKNGWQRTGTAKYKNVLLAFSKTGKTCMITIRETKFNLSTEVSIYITEIIDDSSSFVPPVPANEENIVQ